MRRLPERPALFALLFALSFVAGTHNSTLHAQTPRLRGGAAGAPQSSMLRSLGSLLVQARASWGASLRVAAEDAVMEDVYGAGKGGSGAINEKTVVGARKASDLAPLLHASFGLDHYPNYLQRW